MDEEEPLDDVATCPCKAQPVHTDVPSHVDALAGLANASLSHSAAAAFFSNAACLVRGVGKCVQDKWLSFQQAIKTARRGSQLLLDCDFPNAPGANKAEKIMICWCVYVALQLESSTDIDPSKVRLVFMDMGPYHGIMADAAAWVHCGAPFPLPQEDKDCSDGSSAGGGAPQAGKGQPQRSRMVKQHGNKSQLSARGKREREGLPPDASCVRESFRLHRYWMEAYDPVTHEPLLYHANTNKFDTPEYRPLLRVLAGLNMRGDVPTK